MFRTLNRQGIMKKQIAIYQDYIHNNGNLFKALRSYFKEDSIEFFDASDVLNDALTSAVALFVMPGGASRYVADKLNGAGNAKIKEYVAQGGTYLGICSGAYYGSRRTEWRKGQKDEICVDNELGFFPGTCVGPIEALMSGDHMAAVTTIRTPDGRAHKAFYWGGGAFHSDHPASFDVLATYEDASPAIVTGKAGVGRYILSAPHIEIDSARLDLMRFDVSDNRYADIAALKDTDGMTTDLFHTLLQRFVD